MCEEKEPQDVTGIRAEAAHDMKKKPEVQKLHYDSKHAKPKQYEVGQQVFVCKTKCSNDGKSRKLEPKYHGSLLIAKVLDNDRYIADDMPGAKRLQKAYVGICPFDTLKPFKTAVSSDTSGKSDGYDY